MQHRGFNNYGGGREDFGGGDSGRQSRYGSLGTGGGMGGGGASRADEVDNWAAGKKPSSNFGFRSSGPETDRWTRGVGVGGGSNEVNQERPERPRLVLNPPKADAPVTVTDVIKTSKPNPFGTARPREEVLAEKGLDWRKLETDIDSKKTSSHSSRPTSAHSSRPSSAHSGRSETQGLENVSKPSKPKVNPFGDAKPREVLLQERGQDWRKIDRELEHRSIDRPETEEERLLKEEINKLKEDFQKQLSVEENKEAVQASEGDQSSLKETISQKEKELETLIRDLDDKVRFRQKPFDRPGSGAGRTPGFSDRPSSRSGSVDESRNAEFSDRPRSRGAPDIWTRPVDERRSSYQGGRGERGFLGSREFDRPRSRDRW
ncbi:Eukaryotic translation initiation factor 4B1 [Linum perenne]